MEHSAYIKARKALVQRGWLIHEDGKITLNFDELLKDAEK